MTAPTALSADDRDLEDAIRGRSPAAYVSKATPQHTSPNTTRHKVHTRLISHHLDVIRPSSSLGLTLSQLLYSIAMGMTPQLKASIAFLKAALEDRSIQRAIHLMDWGLTPSQVIPWVRDRDLRSLLEVTRESAWYLSDHAQRTTHMPEAHCVRWQWRCNVKKPTKSARTEVYMSCIAVIG